MNGMMFLLFIEELNKGFMIHCFHIQVVVRKTRKITVLVGIVSHILLFRYKIISPSFLLVSMDSQFSGMTIPFSFARSSYFFRQTPSGSYLAVSSFQISGSFLMRWFITVVAPFSWASVHFLQPVSKASWMCSGKA